MTQWTAKRSFDVLLIGLGLATLYLVWGYLSLFFLALVLVVVFEPVYVSLLTWVRRPGWASLLTTVVIFLVVIVPLVLLITAAVQQARDLILSIPQWVVKPETANRGWGGVLDTYLPGILSEVDRLILNQQTSLANSAQSLAQSVGQILTKGVIPVVASGTKAILDTVVFILMLVYLFPVKKKMMKKIQRLSPLDPERYEQFMRRFEVVTRTTIKSTLFVGVAQGVLGAVMLWVLGVPTAALWGVMMGVAAFVPFGAGLVWWPIGIVLLLTGQWLKGLIWIGWGLLVISTVDNVIRSKVLGTGEAAIPELVTFIAVLGGVQAFGFLGVILGPLIAALFLTALDFYLEDRDKSRLGSGA